MDPLIFEEVWERNLCDDGVSTPWMMWKQPPFVSGSPGDCWGCMVQCTAAPSLGRDQIVPTKQAWHLLWFKSVTHRGVFKSFSVAGSETWGVISNSVLPTHRIKCVERAAAGIIARTFQTIRRRTNYWTKKISCAVKGSLWSMCIAWQMVIEYVVL